MSGAAHGTRMNTRTMPISHVWHVQEAFGGSQRRRKASFPAQNADSQARSNCWDSKIAGRLDSALADCYHHYRGMTWNGEDDVHCSALLVVLMRVDRIGTRGALSLTCECATIASAPEERARVLSSVDACI